MIPIPQDAYKADITNFANFNLQQQLNASGEWLYSTATIPSNVCNRLVQGVALVVVLFLW